MEMVLTDKHLSSSEKKELEKLLKRQNPELKSDLEQMWYLMDLVWDDFGCDNKKLDWNKIGRFYSHPVWLLNGLFIEQDEVSMSHRHAISDWIVQKRFEKVVDYGGGFGTLARLIAEKSSGIRVFIYEPHPSEFGLKRAEEFSNITIIESLGKEYDCLVSTDVLEHVADPLNDFYNMVKSVKVGGYLVIANAFFPMIKCHLPQNFHFRYSFNIFAEMFGVEIVDELEGSHATIFKRVDEIEPNWKKVRLYEKVSKTIFPFIEFSKPVLRPLKRLMKK